MKPSQFILLALILVDSFSVTFAGARYGKTPVATATLPAASKPLIDPKRSSSPSVISPSAVLTKCCWCVTGDQNEVFPYFGTSDCEGRSSAVLNMSCRGVSVIDSGCALIEAKRDCGNVRMVSKKLTYLDDMKHLREINPPEPISPRLESSPVLPSVYCSCRRDPKDTESCQVTRTNHDDITILETRKMIAGQSDCSYEECEKIFSVEKYTPLCPAYVQGSP